MIKKLGLFGFILLAIGTGLTLYLPDQKITEAPPATFTILEKSLLTPVDQHLLLSSRYFEDEKIDEQKKYGLQAGLYGTLNHAKMVALGFNQKKLSFKPTIFKAQEQERQWFVIAFGPFDSH